MYLVAEQRVLKVNYPKKRSSESAIQVIFAPEPRQEPGEIIGVAVSILHSLVFIHVKKKGLFAFTMYGEFVWNMGPVFERFGYYQGCKGTLNDCHFSSAPVLDQCEGSIYVSYF